ncbi:MAG TPA: proprotein convertase P-domain-containing protein, partial [Saprospiraceae bacterium]|nr:proprotein convertase P-domain-containing protein [Saprospiraceae bacterium]
MFNLLPLLANSARKAVYFLTAVLFFACSLQTAGAQDCVCTNCPQFMPDGFTGSFYIQIQNAANPTLGQNGQGVCGVRLTFDHEYIGDLQITLTSPGGQTVTLIGPVGLFGPTDFTTWDILFLPCADPVSPDPGFSDQWNNNQPWGLFGAYTGSYYPAAGCLENFNSGPVNGQWTLTVSDLQANDVGNFYNYEIIFCDPTGINCFSCAANAGNLLQADVVACEGDPALNLNLPPTYVAPNAPPPAPDYSYTYIVGGPGGVIQAYETGPDLSGYPAGSYTVCGLSYLTSQEGDIPVPNGTLTIAQLSTQLNSNQPPFCGKITSNCVNVTIKPSPEDEEEFQEICAPQCYLFHNQSYCQTGTYVRNLTQNGCPYTATLYLTVLQPTFKTINETICEDGCSQTPGFGYACSSGTYQETFINEAGCDSIVTLNVNVMAIQANIVQPPPQIPCNQSPVTLQGSGSTTGPGTLYLWTASNGGHIVGSATGINVNVNAPGDYQLRVCRTLSGTTCCDSTAVTVSADQSIPGAPVAINGPGQICPGQTATYSIAAVPGATTYTWTVPSGVTINSGQNTTSLNVTWNSNSGGDICVAAGNACGLSTPTCLTVTLAPVPVPTTPQGAATVCAGNTESYSITPVTGATGYNWSVTAPAVILSGQGTTGIAVNWGNAPAGNVCVNITGACGTSQDVCLPVQINAAPAAPQIAGDSILCLGFNGNYSITPIAGATGYNWSVPAGGNITSGQNTTSITVNWTDEPGGNVCVTANNGCGDGPQDCFSVTVDQMPTANAGADDAECGTTASLQAITSVSGGAGQWTTVSGPGTATFVNPNAAATSVSVTINGTYIFQWTESKNNCSDSDSMAVSFNDSPAAGLIVTDCDPTSQNYTVTFPITGGAAPYIIAGGTISNNVFTSDPIPSGQSYSFFIVDANSCISPVITGSIDCNCATNAGQMSLQPLSTCEGGTITTQHLGGENLDPNDVAAYMLHDNSGPSLGQIYAQNTNGVFTFQNGMSYGTTYYVSYVVGNNLNGTPDPNDPCLSVSQGQPVTFFQNPVSFAGVDADTCGFSLQLLAGQGN